MLRRRVSRGAREPADHFVADAPQSGPQALLTGSPLIADGSVEIVAVAQGGAPFKIAVRSRVPGLNAKGACIGPMGQRVRNVMSELSGEKIDIIDHDDDPTSVRGQCSVAGEGRVGQRRRCHHSRGAGHRAGLPAVPGDRQRGQNARLAARLTGWRIDIRSDASDDDASSGRRTKLSAPTDRASGFSFTSPAKGGSSGGAMTVDCAVIQRESPLPETRHRRTEGPVRTCIGCRERTLAVELLRMVAVSGGMVIWPLS